MKNGKLAWRGVVASGKLGQRVSLLKVRKFLLCSGRFDMIDGVTQGSVLGWWTRRVVPKVGSKRPIKMLEWFYSRVCSAHCISSFNGRGYVTRENFMSLYYAWEVIIVIATPDKRGIKTNVITVFFIFRYVPFLVSFITDVFEELVSFLL